VSYKVAGIDVHKKVLMVVVCEVAEPESLPQRRRFGTTTSELRRLSQWLRECGVEEAVMESTAQYWKPVWYELEPHLRLQLAQAFSNRAPRGRTRRFRTRRDCRSGPTGISEQKSGIAKFTLDIDI
jgi:hypothetical protein